MTNPFRVRFDSECARCLEIVEYGEAMFAHEEEFICKSCARTKQLICQCGNYKKPEYGTCYSCYDDSKEVSEWNV